MHVKDGTCDVTTAAMRDYPLTLMIDANCLLINGVKTCTVFSHYKVLVKIKGSGSSSSIDVTVSSGKIKRVLGCPISCVALKKLMLQIRFWDNVLDAMLPLS